MLRYIAKEKNGVHVVWLSGINRYILFQEPAFRVFSMMMEERKVQEIAGNISDLYGLPPEEATRFADEVITGIEGLSATGSEAIKQEIQPGALQKVPGQTMLKKYNLNGTAVQLTYGNSYIAEQIHPKLQHLETCLGNEADIQTFTLGYSEGSYFLEPGNNNIEKSHFDRIEELAGGIYLQLLKILYGISSEEWMGVAHASAVTDGKEAVLFVAPCGGGKSTIASLMLANGYKLISDDFVPLAMSEPEVYAFPAGISVKEAAIPLMSRFFPELSQINLKHRNRSGRYGVFLPFPDDSLSIRNVKARAIVFVQYDKSVGCSLKKVTNSEFMERFLTESWIADNPEAAGRFIEWFFDLEVYSLRYSDNKKAVGMVAKLFS